MRVVKRHLTCRALDGMADEGNRLDNRMVEDGGRFDALPQLFDAVTFRLIDALGQAAGWRG